MPRKNFFPEVSWKLDVDHIWTMAIHTNDMVIMNPQLDLDHPDDLDTQTSISIKHILNILKDVGCGAEDLTNIRVQYVNTGNVDEDKYLKSIVEQFGNVNGAVIEMLPFDRLVLPELLVEICAYAMLGQDGSKIERRSVNPAGFFHPGGSFSQGMKSGQMIYVGGQLPRNEDGSIVKSGNFAEQSKVVMDNFSTVLNELDADFDDLIRLNVFYDVNTSENDWKKFGEMLKSKFNGQGPALTAVPLPRMYPDGVQIMMCGWAMRGIDGQRLEKKYSGLENAEKVPGTHFYRHGVKCGDIVILGGQSAISSDGKAEDPDDHVMQTRKTIANIDSLLEAFDCSRFNIHKTNSYYVLKTVEEFNTNLETRTEYFKKPGPGSVGLPLDTLSVKDVKIEMEAILVVE